MTQRYSCADEAELDRGLAAALEALRSGELVVLPTDTVYGVAADAFEPAAVQRLLRAKGRGRDMPPPVLVSSATTLDALATGVPGYVRDVVAELWPGPLTVICHQQPSLSWDLGDTRETVAVRMPDDTYALALLEQSGPLAVSSANTTGRPAACSADEAQDMLGDAVEVYLDGGPTTGDVPSTILDVTGDRGVVVRQGAVSPARLRELAGDTVGIDGEATVSSDAEGTVGPDAEGTVSSDAEDAG